MKQPELHYFEYIDMMSQVELKELPFQVNVIKIMKLWYLVKKVSITISPFLEVGFKNFCDSLCRTTQASLK